MVIRWFIRWRLVARERGVALAILSQFFSIMGFSFALPFAPFYLQTMGVTDPAELKFFIALFGAATPLGLTLCSPLWGWLADRFGRRRMLLRANIAGTIIVALMGLARTPWTLVALRLMQGMFTGTTTAAQAVVSAETPLHRSGQAFGLLSAAVYSGSLAGMLVGGWVAETIGFRVAFLVGASLLLVAALLVGVGSDRPPARATSEPATPSAWRPPPTVWMGLALVGLFSFARQFDVPFVPLRVQELHGQLSGSTVRTGVLNTLGGVAGLVSGLVVSRLADRYRVRSLIAGLAAGSAVFLALHVGVGRFIELLPIRFVMVFCAGGVEPVLQMWLTRNTPAARRGAVFGWAGAARSLGWFAAPLVAGGVAARLGLRGVFLAGSLIYATLASFVLALHRRDLGQGQPRAGLLPSD